MPKTPSQRQSEFRKRLREEGGRVVAFAASADTVEFLEANQANGIGPAKAINDLVSGSRKKSRSTK